MPELPQIPLQEYLQRLERLRALMRPNDFQAVLLGTGTNLRYFSGYPSPARSGSRPFFLLLPLAGDPVFIVHCGRKAEAQRFSWVKDVREYTQLSQVPVQLIREALKQCGALGGKLGMELGFEQSFDVPYLEFSRLQRGLPATTIVDAGPYLWRLRMIKSEAELACQRRACQILSDAYAKTFTAVREGTTELEVANHLRAHFENEGATDHWILITSGRGNYDLATKLPEARPVRRGDMVWIERAARAARSAGTGRISLAPQSWGSHRRSNVARRRRSTRSPGKGSRRCALGRALRNSPKLVIPGLLS